MMEQALFLVDYDAAAGMPVLPLDVILDGTLGHAWANTTAPGLTALVLIQHTNMDAVRAALPAGTVELKV